MEFVVLTGVWMMATFMAVFIPIVVVGIVCSYIKGGLREVSDFLRNQVF